MKRWSRGWRGILLLVVSACPLLGLFPAASYGDGAEGNGRPPAERPILDVQRDKDKTVYTIGGSSRDIRKDDTDRAWDLLDNVAIDPRGDPWKKAE